MVALHLFLLGIFSYLFHFQIIQYIFYLLSTNHLWLSRIFFTKLKLWISFLVTILTLSFLQWRIIVTVRGWITAVTRVLSILRWWWYTLNYFSLNHNFLFPYTKTFSSNFFIHFLSPAYLRPLHVFQILIFLQFFKFSISMVPPYIEAKPK